MQYEKVFEILFDRHVMPEWSGWNRAMKAMNGTIDFVKTAIDQHKSNYNEDVKENPKGGIISESILTLVTLSTKSVISLF